MKIHEITEQVTGKITTMRPGQAAEIDHGDGTKTVVDLKKANLTKDPATKKVKVIKKNTQGAADPTQDIKPGDEIADEGK